MNPEATAARLVEQSLGRSAIESKQVKGRGTVNSVVVVRTPEGRVVVRIAQKGRDEFAKEQWAMAVARAQGLECPEVLTHGWTGDGDDRRAFCVQTFVGTRDAEQTDDVWFEVGRQLRRLHGVTVRGWGLDMTEPGSFDSRLENHLRYNIESLGDGDPLRERGLLDAQESASLRALFERMATRRWRLGLCHGDVALRNLRILADGRVALLDWGCARADVVPSREFAELEREHDPGGAAFEALLGGYGLTWSEVREDVSAVSLLSCTDLSRWCLDQCAERIGYYGALLRWALDQHLHDAPWRPAPEG